VTDETILRILDMTREGMTVREIAALPGFSHRTVGRHVAQMRREGILAPKSPGVQPAPRDMSDATNSRIIALAREGKTAAEIGVATGMKASTVGSRLWMMRRDGILPPKSTGRPGADLSPLDCDDYEPAKADHEGFIAALTKFHQKPVPLPAKDTVLHQIAPVAPLSCVGSPALLCERS
jgi:hypothetical protein